jgi:hypothetical protein
MSGVVGAEFLCGKKREVVVVRSLGPFAFVTLTYLHTHTYCTYELRTPTLRRLLPRGGKKSAIEIDSSIIWRKEIQNRNRLLDLAGRNSK